MNIFAGVIFTAATLAIAATAATAQERGAPFREHDLVGAWEYESAYVELPDGTTTNNFGPRPRGVFIIRASGDYSHIVMADDLPQIASGALKNVTDAEARAVATNVLAHFGTWRAEPRAGRFTVKIAKSSFANFDGIEQVRVVTRLDRRRLAYRNLQASNGGGAVIVAILRRLPDKPRGPPLPRPHPRRGHDR